jgi:hypothetical protein
MFEIFKSSRFETTEQFCEKLNKSTRFFPLFLIHSKTTFRGRIFAEVIVYCCSTV